MNIARKKDRKEIKIGEAMAAYEYPVMDASINGAVIELRGRYPKEGRVLNEKVVEMGYVLSGSGKVVIEEEEIEFTKGDQILIKPGEKYFWEANAKVFMSCTPAWYPEQHKEVE